MLLNKNIFTNCMKWGDLAKSIIRKSKNCYISRLRMIENEIIKENKEKERIKNEFDVQSDIEMPRIYKKYIIEKDPGVDPMIGKAYEKSKLFIFSHNIQSEAYKTESGGIFKSVIGIFGKKPEVPVLCDNPMDEISTAEKEKLELIEKQWDIENLYKGVQEAITRKARDQNEITKILFTIKIAFCENHVALANSIRNIQVTLIMIYKEK